MNPTPTTTNRFTTWTREHPIIAGAVLGLGASLFGGVAGYLVGARDSTVKNSAIVQAHAEWSAEFRSFIEVQKSLASGWVEAARQAEAKITKLSGTATTIAADASAAARHASQHAAAAGSDARMAAAELERARKLASFLGEYTEATGQAMAAEVLKNENTKKVLVDEVKKLANVGVPVGTITAWMHDIRPPEEWRRCDGTRLSELNLSADEERELRRSVLIKHDKLPDFRGCFLRGHDSSGEIDKEMGRVLGKLQTDSTRKPNLAFRAIPSKDFQDHDHGAGYVQQGKGSGKLQHNTNDTLGVARSSKQSASKDHTHEIDGGDLETRPVNYAVHWIIRVK